MLQQMVGSFVIQLYSWADSDLSHSVFMHCWAQLFISSLLLISNLYWGLGQKHTLVCVFLFYFDDFFFLAEMKDYSKSKFRVKSVFCKPDFSSLAHRGNCPLTITIGNQSFVKNFLESFLIQTSSWFPSGNNYTRVKYVMLATSSGFGVFFLLLMVVGVVYLFVYLFVWFWFFKILLKTITLESNSVFINHFPDIDK